MSHFYKTHTIICEIATPIGTYSIAEYESEAHNGIMYKVLYNYKDIGFIRYETLKSAKYGVRDFLCTKRKQIDTLILSLNEELKQND